MRSLSVTTISRMSRYGKLRSRSGIRSMSSGVSQIPRTSRTMWLKRWHASPTVGVYTIGISSARCSTSTR